MKRLLEAIYKLQRKKRPITFDEYVIIHKEEQSKARMMRRIKNRGYIYGRRG